MPADAYFRSVATEVFAETLGRLGARIVVGADPWMVRFEASQWFVELVAFLRDGPKYSPRVHIGPLPERRVDPRDRAFDILHTLPDDSSLRRYNLIWRYSNEAEMRACYTRVLNEIFEPYAVNVLCDPDRLASILNFRTEQNAIQSHAQIRDHNESVSRGKARRALEAGDDRTYLVEMARIAPERQSPSERARVKYIRKKTGWRSIWSFLRNPMRRR